MFTNDPIINNIFRATTAFFLMIFGNVILSKQVTQLVNSGFITILITLFLFYILFRLAKGAILDSEKLAKEDSDINGADFVNYQRRNKKNELYAEEQLIEMVSALPIEDILKLSYTAIDKKLRTIFRISAPYISGETLRYFHEGQWYSANENKLNTLKKDCFKNAISTIRARIKASIEE